MPQYFSVATLQGQAKIADAVAGGAVINITEIAAGDGNGSPTTPLETQTALVREVWRGTVLSASRDPNNPTHVIINANIPSAEGPFTIRELGLFTSDGQMFAVMNHPEVEKTTAAQGATQDVVVNFRVVIDTAAEVTVTVDPSVLISVGGLLRPPFIAIDGFATAAPTNPAGGDLYVVGASATGVFSGQDHKFAQWNGTLWIFAAAAERTIVGDADGCSYYRRTQTGWVPWVADGIEYGLSNVIWITSDVTKTVGAGQDFATLADAMDWLQYRLIARGATVTFSLAAGDHTLAGTIDLRHPTADRLKIVGQAPVGAFPGIMDLSATEATSLATINSRWPTRILAAGFSPFQFGPAGIGLLSNVALIGNGSAVGIQAYGISDILASDVAVHGFNDNIDLGSSRLNATNLFSSHATNHGINCSNTGYCVGTHWDVAGAGAVGFLVQRAASATITDLAVRYSGSINVLSTQQASAYFLDVDSRNATTHNYASGDGAYMTAVNPVTSSPGSNSFYVYNGGRMLLDNANSTSGASPAVNTVGNYESFIRSV